MSASEGPIADLREDHEVLESAVVHDGAVWDVVRERFALPGSTPVREFVKHSGAVAVVAVDDEDRILLIRQYRHPIRTREWELPAGLLDVAGEPAVEAAKRELAEEADLAAEHWEPLISFHTTPGGSDERLQLFLARGLRETTTDFERTEEESELESRWVPVDEVVEAALAGRLENGILLIGVLAYVAGRR